MQTTPIRILIVEDEGLIAADIERRLKAIGHTVCGIADNGEQAVAEATRQRPRLVLMDIRLKGDMDGIQASNLIRKRLQIPVVYLTSYADSETLQRAADTNPLGYVVKPFTQSQLQSTIEIALCQHRRETRLMNERTYLESTLMKRSLHFDA